MSESQKISCRVGPVIENKIAAWHDGLVHLATDKFDEHFSVWYGAINVICNLEEYRRLMNASEAHLQLENGRQGGILVLAGHSSEAVILPHMVRAEEYRLVYFIVVGKLG